MPKNNHFRLMSILGAFMVIFAFAACGDGAGGGGGGGGGDVDPILTGIDVNWAALKNFGIGEPLNSAEKVWTITATFDNSTTKTLQNNIAGISWEPVDFSATAGTNKTVTVSYGGKSFPITGINVQTLNERVAAVASGATATINLYADEIVSQYFIISGRDITLKGVGGERNINNNCSSTIFDLRTNAKLTFGENLTLKSLAVSHSGPAINFSMAPSTFIMKEGSKITGHNCTGNGAAISSPSASGPFYIIIEGGEISGNSSASKGAGVFTNTGTNASFVMSGGKIVNNTSYGIGDDVRITADNPPIILSGNAQIGDLALHAFSNVRKSTITVAGDFEGSVTQLDLEGYGFISDAKNQWTTGIPVVAPEEGQSLTKALLDRFALGKFESNVTGNPTESITPGYHIYGTQDGEDNTDYFGRLTAD